MKLSLTRVPSNIGLKRGKRMYSNELWGSHSGASEWRLHSFGIWHCVCVRAEPTYRSSLLHPCSGYVDNTFWSGIFKTALILSTGTRLRQAVTLLSRERSNSAHWIEIWWTLEQWREKSIPLWLSHFCPRLISKNILCHHQLSWQFCLI